jgi:hypothetical protein
MFTCPMHNVDCTVLVGVSTVYGLAAVGTDTAAVVA